MLVALILALLLADTTQAVSQDIPELGPSRRINGMAQMSKLPQHIESANPVYRAPRLPRLTLTMSGYAGEGSPYQAYPLPPLSAYVRGLDGELIINLFGRLHIVADAQKHLSGDGWSTDLNAQMRLMSHGRISLDAVAQSYGGSSSDLLYQGPADVGLGMRLTSSLLLMGGAIRLGNVDYPTVEITTLMGRSRYEQAPQLWLNGTPFNQSDPLTQIARNPVILYRIRSSWKIGGRLALTGAATFTDWRGETSLFTPNTSITVQAGVRYGVWRWCSVGLKARWSDDNRGPALNRSALTIGLTFQKR